MAAEGPSGNHQDTLKWVFTLWVVIDLVEIDNWRWKCFVAEGIKGVIQKKAMNEEDISPSQDN